MIDLIARLHRKASTGGLGMELASMFTLVKYHATRQHKKVIEYHAT